MDTHQQKLSGTRIFENPVLEALTKTSPLITLYSYSAITLLLTGGGAVLTGISIYRAGAIFFAGLLFWSLFEYIMHRWVFHINEHMPGTDRFQFIVHGVHHSNPKDEERVFMPPVPGVVITSLLLGLNYFIMGLSAFYFTAGMTLGYMLYAYIHYSVHNRPPHPRLRKLWQHHALPHYRYPDKAFGVSSPLWDMVFGTMPPKESERHAPHPRLN